MDPNETPEPRSNNSRVLLWVALVLVLLVLMAYCFTSIIRKASKTKC